MNTTTYQPSYGEIAVLGEMFQKEVEVRGIKFPKEDQRTGAWLDYVQQYENNHDKDPHIYCLENVTCEKEVSEIDWDEVFG